MGGVGATICKVFVQVDGTQRFGESARIADRTTVSDRTSNCRTCWTSIPSLSLTALLQPSHAAPYHLKSLPSYSWWNY